MIYTSPFNYSHAWTMGEGSCGKGGGRESRNKRGWKQTAPRYMKPGRGLRPNGGRRIRPCASWTLDVHASVCPAIRPFSPRPNDPQFQVSTSLFYRFFIRSHITAPCLLCPRPLCWAPRLSRAAPHKSARSRTKKQRRPPISTPRPPGRPPKKQEELSLMEYYAPKQTTAGTRSRNPCGGPSPCESVSNSPPPSREEQSPPRSESCPGPPTAGRGAFAPLPPLLGPMSVRARRIQPC